MTPAILHRALRLAVLAALGVVLAACGSTGGDEEGPYRPTGAGGRYRVGTPYEVKGVWYYPKEDPLYDETGIASWYGAAFAGRKTANGEIFDPGLVSAAHKTLPMPVNVRVTTSGTLSCSTTVPPGRTRSRSSSRWPASSPSPTWLVSRVAGGARSWQPRSVCCLPLFLTV